MTASAAWTLVRVAVSAAVLAWVARGIDVTAALGALAGFSLAAIGAALALVAVDRLLMMWRWRLLVRPATDLPDRALAHIFFVSSFIGSFLPAGVGGDAARAFAVGRHSGQAGPAMASVIVDRWLGLLAVGLSGCAGLLLTLRGVPDEARGLVVTATVILVCGTVAGLFADRLLERLAPSWLRTGRLWRLAVRLAAALAEYRDRGAILAKVALLSVAVQALRIVLAFVLGRSLGIDLPFRYYWVFMPLNILVILLPLSLGGFGLPQGTMVWTLGPLGVAPTPAFLLSTLFVGIGIIGNLPGAWLYATGRALPGGAARPPL